MKRLCGFLFLVGVVLLSASPVFSAPSKPPPQPQPGPITSLPITLESPGYYYLTGNLSYSGTTDAITVKSDNVTIDLMGFCLSGPGSSGGCAISSRDSSDPRSINGYRNVEVRNGSLNGWGFAFFGFSGNRALNLRVENCFNGIMLQDGLVKDCTCDTGGSGRGITNSGVTTGCTITNCSIGIECSGTASGNYVSGCSYAGISASFGTVNGNFVQGCPNFGIWCSGGGSIINNMVLNDSNTVWGIYVNAYEPCLVTQNIVMGPNPFKSEYPDKVVIVNNAGF